MDAGAACSGHIRANSEEELTRKLAEHLQNKHKVKNVSQTLVNYTKTAVRSE